MATGSAACPFEVRILFYYFIYFTILFIILFYYFITLLFTLCLRVRSSESSFETRGSPFLSCAGRGASGALCVFFGGSPSWAWQPGPRAAPRAPGLLTPQRERPASGTQASEASRCPRRGRRGRKCGNRCFRFRSRSLSLKGPPALAGAARWSARRPAGPKAQGLGSRRGHAPGAQVPAQAPSGVWGRPPAHVSLSHPRFSLPPRPALSQIQWRKYPRGRVKKAQPAGQHPLPWPCSRRAAALAFGRCQVCPPPPAGLPASLPALRFSGSGLSPDA